MSGGWRPSRNYEHAIPSLVCLCRCRHKGHQHGMHSLDNACRKRTSSLSAPMRDGRCHSGKGLLRSDRLPQRGQRQRQQDSSDHRNATHLRDIPTGSECPAVLFGLNIRGTVLWYALHVSLSLFIEANVLKQDGPHRHSPRQSVPKSPVTIAVQNSLAHGLGDRQVPLETVRQQPRPRKALRATLVVSQPVS